jgi:hypothetical protein
MKKNYPLILLVLFVLVSCNNDKKRDNNNFNETKNAEWQEVLKQKMPYLGHRNWIVITDMAYPLQSGDGIITLYANEPYDKVLKTVKDEVDKAPHVFAHVYHDKELSLLTETDVPDIQKLRSRMDEICGKNVEFLPHVELIKKLDEAGKLFTIVIIKTPLTMAYTSTFFELDCKYWNADKQARLDKAMK